MDDGDNGLNFEVDYDADDGDNGLEMGRRRMSIRHIGAYVYMHKCLIEACGGAAEHAYRISNRIYMYTDTRARMNARTFLHALTDLFVAELFRTGR